MSTIQRIRARTLVIAIGLGLSVFQSRANAATKVAIIDNGINPSGTQWCSLLNNNGYECTLFPPSGPTTSLNAFAVVIDMSSEWTDSGHLLADVMASGRGVITRGWAPYYLGIDSDPIVQAWIGANRSSYGTDFFTTTAMDSILGDRPPGTVLGTKASTARRGLTEQQGTPTRRSLHASIPAPARLLYFGTSGAMADRFISAAPLFHLISFCGRSANSQCARFLLPAPGD